MKSNCNKPNKKSLRNSKKSFSFQLITVFCVLIFVFVPLAEIVTDFTYNHIIYYSNTNFCPMGLDTFNILSFKEIK